MASAAFVRGSCVCARPGALGAAMMRILILYGTTDGHTATIARRLASMLETRGAESDPIDAAEAKP